MEEKPDFQRETLWKPRMALNRSAANTRKKRMAPEPYPTFHTVTPGCSKEARKPNPRIPDRTRKTTAPNTRRMLVKMTWSRGSGDVLTICGHTPNMDAWGRRTGHHVLEEVYKMANQMTAGLSDRRGSAKNRVAPCGATQVGLTGFEPATSSPPVKRATKLRYSPNQKRTGWDSNPRYGNSAHGISSAAPSAARTPVPVRKGSVQG